MTERGTFIVIEGTEGSGKTIQFERLVLRVPEGAKVGALDFPRYNETSSFFVQKYLTGHYGGDVSPFAAAAFYAMDRFDAKLKILQWLEDGRRVIANRYVASSMAYQGAKIENKSEREKFYKWLHSFEYEMLGIPKPGASIVLHVPPEIAEKQSSRKGREVRDADPAYHMRVAEAYLEIAALFPNDFRVIECAPGGVLLSADEIHEKVWVAAEKIISG